MSLRGNLRTMSLPEILEWASNNTKTGTLRISWGAVEKRVNFKQGRILSSSSNDPREHLGQFLVGNGLVTEEQLFRALLLQEKEGQMLGAILVESGVLEEPDLKVALQRKARETIYGLFLWPEGEFEFHEGELPERLVPINMSVPEVVFEGIRRVDEWKRLKDLFPTLKTSFRVAADAAAPDDPIRRRALELAQQGHTLAEISLDLHRSDFDTACLFRELHQSGHVSVDRVMEEPPPSQRVLDIKGLVDQAETCLAQGRVGEAREAYEQVLFLDRLNQKAKKGLLAIGEFEGRAAMPSAVTLDAVPELRIDLVGLTGQDLDPREGFLLSRVNGEWNVQSILKVCPMSEGDALGLLAGLLQRGVIGLRS